MVTDQQTSQKINSANKINSALGKTLTFSRIYLIIVVFFLLIYLLFRAFSYQLMTSPSHTRANTQRQNDNQL